MKIDTIPGKDWDKYLENTSDKQVLILALSKAEKNGMKPVGKIRLKDGDAVEADHIYDGYYESIILSIEFAKAFWKNDLLGWDYQLEQMVIEDNRIDYLKDFL